MAEEKWRDNLLSWLTPLSPTKWNSYSSVAFCASEYYKYQTDIPAFTVNPEVLYWLYIVTTDIPMKLDAVHLTV